MFGGRGEPMTPSDMLAAAFAALFIGLIIYFYGREPKE